MSRPSTVHLWRCRFGAVNLDKAPVQRSAVSNFRMTYGTNAWAILQDVAKAARNAAPANA